MNVRKSITGYSYNYAGSAKSIKNVSVVEGLTDIERSGGALYFYNVQNTIPIDLSSCH